MQHFVFFGFLCSLFIQQCFLLPTKKDINKQSTNNKIDEKDLKEEYLRYIQESIMMESIGSLQTDKSSEIQPSLLEKNQFIQHNSLRSKLDELNRVEVEKLKQLVARKHELENNIENDKEKYLNKEYISRLIEETMKNLQEIDNQRKEKFKEYEMQKAIQREERIMRNTDRNKMSHPKIDKFNTETNSRDKDHRVIHYPGSRKQLEEVWNEQDQMDDDFRPKSFFLLHDLDGNEFWDRNEVKALFLRELDKIYTDGASEAEILKRAEEMERMREQLFQDADINRDGLISFHEFLDKTKRTEFEEDKKWKPLNEDNIFSIEEYERFKHNRNENSPHITVLLENV